MTNIEKITELLKDYRRMTAFYDAEFRDGVENLRSNGHENSRYYENELTRLSENKAENMRILRKRISKDAAEIIGEMRKNAAREKPPAPTREVIETLELLRMKDRVLQSELDGAVDVCRSNQTALAVCAEIAMKHNLTLYGAGARSTVGNTEITDGIDSLENHVRWTLRLDKINRKNEYYAQAVEGISPTGRMIADPDGALKARHDIDFSPADELAAFVGISDLAKFEEITG